MIIKIYEVSGNALSKKIGIHLIDPSTTEVNNSIGDAINKGFQTIYMHRSLGFRKGKKLVGVCEI